jgi:hypothetical protein
MLEVPAIISALRRRKALRGVAIAFRFNLLRRIYLAYRIGRKALKFE